MDHDAASQIHVRIAATTSSGAFRQSARTMRQNGVGNLSLAHLCKVQLVRIMTKPQLLAVPVGPRCMDQETRPCHILVHKSLVGIRASERNREHGAQLERARSQDLKAYYSSWSSRGCQYTPLQSQYHDY